MKRKMATILLVVIMLLTMLPITTNAATLPTVWKAPGSLAAGVAAQCEYSTSLFFSVDSALLKFIDEEQTDHDALGIDSVGNTAQIDWKLNNGNWHYTADWDTLSGEYPLDSGLYASTGYLSGETTDDVSILDLRNNPGEITALQKELNTAMIKGTSENGEDNRLDLKNNTFYFRVRVMANYHVTNKGENKYILSPWSEVLSYGKDGAVLVKPTKLEKPTISTPTIGKNNDGSPKITFTVVTPKQVQDANNYIQVKDYSSLAVEHQMNINNTGWIEAQAGVWWLASDTRSIEVPVTFENGKIVKIDEAYIQIRMRYTYTGGANTGALTSEWSNIISVNTPAWGNAHSWATTELQKADEAELIPDILKGADLTKTINREEFAELAVLLYEKVTKKAAIPTSPNPFKDTENQQILKAYNLKITAGLTPTTFGPKVLINREQCATMLFNAMKAIAPNGAYSTTGVNNFPDQKYISSWAVASTKYMSKAGIIKGDSKGNFMPKATTTVQVAASYGMATREAAIITASRTYEHIK